jgi:hypothetical protein
MVPEIARPEVPGVVERFDFYLDEVGGKELGDP